MVGELKDAVALVTGAGGGIGRAAALELASRGADVGVHYHHNETGASETVHPVEALGRRAAAFPGDLTRHDEAGALVSSVLAASATGGAPRARVRRGRSRT